MNGSQRVPPSEQKENASAFHLRSLSVKSWAHDPPDPAARERNIWFGSHHSELGEKSQPLLEGELWRRGDGAYDLPAGDGEKLGRAGKVSAPDSVWPRQYILGTRDGPYWAGAQANNVRLRPWMESPPAPPFGRTAGDGEKPARAGKVSAPGSVWPRR